MNYPPPLFRFDDRAELHALVRAAPLATWVQAGPNGLNVTHLPCLLMPEPGQEGEQGHFLAHVARNNPAWQWPGAAPESVLIFHGPQAYITPNWYPAKAVHGREVPTWNYLAVHAHVRLHVIDEPAGKRAILDRLTQTHEAGNERPWSINDAPADYIDKLLGAIVGLRFEVVRWEGRRKASQNKDATTHGEVICGLRARAQGDDLGLADAMVRHAPAAKPAP